MIAAVITKGAHGHRLRKKRNLSSRSQDSSSITRCSIARSGKNDQTSNLVDMWQAVFQTKSIINDLEKRGTSKTFSEASRRPIRDLGEIELYELGEISNTIQCPTCLRYSREGTFYCTCGVCSMPSPAQTRKIITRFEIMSVPCCTVKEDDCLGAKHGRERWQYDHWKAKDATRGVFRRNYRSILHR